MNRKPLGRHVKQKKHLSRHDETRSVLDSTLAELEANLETPVVPGELIFWAAAIQTSFDKVAPALREEVEENHPKEFAEISEEDPEMLRQVEQLREEDSHLLELYEVFDGTLRLFQKRAEHAEPNEGKLDEQIAELVNSGLELVICIRKQQQALKTWLVEAFQRDTGFGD